MAKQQVIQNTYLSREELSNLARVTKDVLFFSNFVYVINPIHGKVRFNLYPYQKSVLYNFTKERFNIILKFRQAGITELISMYCLWLTMYHPNKKVNIISINDRTSKKVLRKIKFMYKNLPWYMQVPIVNGRAGEYGSASVIEFDNGSFIESIPTSPEAGRSESLTLLVIDEAAMVRWAGEVMSAALPTLSCVKGNTKIIVRKLGYRGEYKSKHAQKWMIETPKIRTLCPKEKGINWDFYKEGYQVLTHDGTWKNILYSQNKGKLKTWTLIDNKGKKISCTPDHKFLTPSGWKSTREIISKDLKVIQVDLKWDELSEKPITQKPETEEIRVLKDFPNYCVSNLGNVYHVEKDGSLKLRKPHYNKSYGTLGFRKGGKIYTEKISHLVYRTFVGDIPKGMVIDHIDCNPHHDYVTNLQCISVSENTSRANKYNPTNILSRIVGHVNPYHDGIILEAIERFPEVSDPKLVDIISSKYGIYVTRKRIQKIRHGQSKVYLSTLKFLKESTVTIYDITVEDNHSYISINNYISHNTGGSAILNSTPKGIGGFYHSTWVDSIAGSNGFNPLRLYWRMHPERDDHWYETMAKALGPRRTAQEIDGDFLGSGNTVFDLGDIKAIEDCLSDYPVIKKKFNGQYRQYLEPEPDKEYFIGADVSTGRNTDYSSFTLMDKEGEEQVVYKGRMAPDKYARLLGDTGQLFGNAVIAPESNDVGLAVTSMLQTEGYPKLYYYQKLIRKKGQSRPEMDKAPGWLTTNKNRSVIIEGLERDIREENIIVKDPFFVQEAYTFIYDGLGRPVAMGKHKTNKDSAGDDDEVYADDDIFGKAICNHIRKGKANVIVQPR